MAPKQFDEILAGAFARNGLNTLLLDIKEGLATVSADLRHVIRRQDEFSKKQDDADESHRKMHERISLVSEQVALLDATVDRIAPLVDQSEARWQQKEGQRKLLTRGRMIGAGLFTAAGGSAGLWHYWDVILRLLHVK